MHHLFPSLSGFIPLVAGVLNLLVALIVYRKDAAFKINRRFSYLCFATALWNIGFFAEEFLRVPPEGRLLLAKVSHIGAALAGPLGLHFIMRFTRTRSGLYLRLLGVSYAVSGAVIVLLILTRLVIRDIATYAFGHYSLWGPLYPLHPLNLIYDYTLMLVLLIQTMRRVNSNVELNRVKYIFAGTVIVVVSTLCNFLPALGIGAWAPGYLGTLFFMILVLFSIYRYRLMNIRLALAKYAMLLALFLVMGAVYSFLLRAMGAVYPPHERMGSAFLFNLAVVGLFLFVYHAALNHAMPGIEKIVYPLKADIKTLLEKLDLRIAASQNAGEVGLILFNLAQHSLKVPGALIYLRREKGAPFLLVKGEGEGAERAEKSLLPGTLLAALKEPVVREEVRRDMDLENFQVYTREKGEALVLELERLGMEAVVPLRAAGEAYGLLFFARKRFGTVYDPQDLSALKLLATRAAVAIANFETFEVLKEKEQMAFAGEMTSLIAHEIKNPLGAIKGASEALLLSGGPSAKLAGIIGEETGRLDRIVRTYLHYIRPLEPELTELDPAKLSLRCRELFLSETAASGFSINIIPPRNPLKVLADADLFKQVFYNIAGNSLEARPDGTLDIMFERENGGGTDLVFRDNCGGMSAETLDRVFRPFFTTKAKGTGLGMAIVKKCVLAMKGNVYISSQQGQGTALRLSFLSCKPTAA